MLDAPDVGLRFFFDQLPWLPGAQRFGDEWVYPGGAHNNRAFFSPRVRFDPQLSEAQQTLCFAPETSGGLLLAVPPLDTGQVLARLEHAWVIGDVVAGDPLLHVQMAA
jgi:selenide,water dikinase